MLKRYMKLVKNKQDVEILQNDKTDAMRNANKIILILDKDRECEEFQDISDEPESHTLFYDNSYDISDEPESHTLF